jgi:hypothetical protein
MALLERTTLHLYSRRPRAHVARVIGEAQARDNDMPVATVMNCPRVTSRQSGSDYSTPVEIWENRHADDNRISHLCNVAGRFGDACAILGLIDICVYPPLSADADQSTPDC